MIGKDKKKKQPEQPKEVHSQTDKSVLRNKTYKKENKRANVPEKPRNKRDRGE